VIELEKERPAGMSRKRFCEYMDLNRSTLYYKPKGESEENLYIMELMDRYYLEHPTAGVMTMVNMLALRGIVVNSKRVRRLLRKMDIWAIYPKKCLSKGGAAKYVHPYLLRGLEVTRPNQVWSTDISYIPMRGGFMYLYAIIDVYSRYIVGWRLSNTLSARNCHELLEDSIAIYGAPEIVNSDQGSQYTTQAWKDLLEQHHVKVSMDGRGRCKDNIWIERFWRSVKQEYVYLNPTDDVDELRNGIRDYIDFYNFKRPHQSLDVLIPAMKYGIVA
jgi:Transposase and inactivated derivatives